MDRDRAGQNNFGAIRLILASVVILSHCYPAIHGNFEGECLWSFTRRQMELSAVAVNLFFATSGYLITLSWLRTPRPGTFLMKRVLRIYPGFVVASVISLIVVAPLAGSDASVAFAPREIIKHLLRVPLLSSPKAAGAFAGHPIEVLNLSLWTIRYEFICYLLVPAICLAVMRFGRPGVLLLYIVTLLLHGAQGKYLVQEGGINLPLLGSTNVWPRFMCYFLGGMILALYRDRIPYDRRLSALCLAALIVAARWTGGFFVVFAIAGVYLLFYVAYQRPSPVSSIGRRWDLSYGAYLYGWPIEMLFVHYLGERFGPWAIFAMAMPVALVLAALSWHFVEEPFMRAKEKFASPSAGLLAKPQQAL
jgi:peptidoglycan/LPS O-acetylase OafA/YrhL